MTSRTEILMKQVRSSPMGRQLVPLEAGTGWPMPSRQATKLFVKLPFYGFRRGKKAGETHLTPPFAIITVDWSNGLPVEYLNLQVRSPDPKLDWNGRVVGMFPHPSIAGLKLSEYKKQRCALLKMYDELFDTLILRKGLPKFWENLFSERLGRLMEPSLLPYYEAMEPDFFAKFLAASEEVARND